MREYQRGQTLVIFAIAALALVFFIGLAVDSGSLYVTYGQLKRAVDASAVSAANEFKRQEAGHEADVIPKMTYAATEILKLQNLDPNSVDLEIRLCDSDFDGFRDADLLTVAPDFYNRCPDTSTGRQARKLIWVRATQEAPLYFLHLLGFDNIPLTTDAIAEAASVDMVLVFDTSESMGINSPGYVFGSDFNPAPCNAADDCEPLKQAKEAAQALIGNLYDGYDRVWVVTFDTQADVRHAPVPGSTLEDASDAIDSVFLHDDAPFYTLFWKSHVGQFNPVNPEDRDGDGEDYDEPHAISEDVTGDTCDPLDPVNPLWDIGDDIPCDLAANLDVFDLNGNGIADDNSTIFPSNSVVSTCTGCGIRVASEVLRTTGRSGSVWVIVFLSDGVPNMSDTPTTAPLDDDLDPYPYGFCVGPGSDSLWNNLCLDWDFTPRYCIDDDEDQCPPGTIWDFQGANPSVNYSALDYARDKTDEAALTRSLNLDEPGGNEISIYTIGLGSAGIGPDMDHPTGEELLRYMAAVGDDGDRVTDPCDGVPARRTCGQYYYATGGGDLEGIFLDIASRIYTRISQ